MNHRHRLISIFLLVLIVGSLIVIVNHLPNFDLHPVFTNFSKNNNNLSYHSLNFFKQPIAPTATVNLKLLPVSKKINNDYHIYQTFNNCGPAALSMALSYFEINQTQQEIGDELRPYQVKNGDNDDKSVTLDEMAGYAQQFGLSAYHRANGDIKLIKSFLTHDLPVITRTWLETDNDIGHYRVIKGFDDSRQVLIQDDSLQGHNLEYSYQEFNQLWTKFNFEYLVLVPEQKQKIAQAILGDNNNKTKSWQLVAQKSRKQLADNPKDIYARFNLAVAYYHMGEYQQSVAAFEQVEAKLPFRTLWYQIEPIKAYYQLDDYQRVLAISNQILNNGNRAFSELYLLRGKIYQKQGNLSQARREFEKAVKYNVNLSEAQQTLNSLSDSKN